MDSNRICQFFLRGRCNRSNCEFRHEKKTKSDAPSTTENSSSGNMVGSKKSDRVCRFFASGSSCRFGENCQFSHEPLASPKKSAFVDDDEESIASGFTDVSTALGNDRYKKNPESQENNEPKSTPGEKKDTLEDLSKDWSDDDDDEDSEDASKEDKQTHEESSNGSSGKSISGEAEAPTALKEVTSEVDSVLPHKEGEEWVTMIFDENGKPSNDSPSSPIIETTDKDIKAPLESSSSNVYDLNPSETDNEGKIERQWPMRRRGGARVRGGFRNRTLRRDSPTGSGGGGSSGVTKIGNNMYMYTGSSAPGEEGDDLKDGEGDRDTEDEEGSISESELLHEETVSLPVTSAIVPVEIPVEGPKPKRKTKKHKAHRTDYVYAGKSTAAKTRRCGECENCNKEDCNKCDACRDKPRNGGKGLKKQACVYRVCLWKNPAGKAVPVPGSRPRGRPRTRPPGLVKAPTSNSNRSRNRSAGASPEKKSSRLSIPVINPKAAAAVDASSAGDSLDVDLPQFDPDKFKPGYVPPVVKKGDEEYVVVVTGIKDTGLCGKYWGDPDSLPSSRRKQRLSGEDSAADSPGSPSTSATNDKSNEQATTAEPANSAASIKTSRSTRRSSAQKESTPTGTPSAKKRKLPTKREVRGKKTRLSTNSSSNEEPRLEAGSLDESSNNTNANDTSTTTGGKDPSSNNNTSNSSSAVRSVSCVADSSTQREVTVECFAPYDDHRWVNIGKERDNMAPDSVMYARALRPPYHLLSFLRIKGNCTKGMSCTDRNTMVFVVLEGEISVVLHTTRFTASKGDSFYIPPKNYYNLINHKVREAELSLIQFQYDGPLPTVAANSQSGGSAPIPASNNTNSNTPATSSSNSTPATNKPSATSSSSSSSSSSTAA